MDLKSLSTAGMAVQMVAPLKRTFVSQQSLQTDPSSLNKLATHKAILESHGITDLGALGTLSLSATIVPQPGLVHAPFVANPAAVPFTTAPLSVRSARVPIPSGSPNAAPGSRVLSGAASALTGAPLAGAASVSRTDAQAAAATGATLPIDTAYWAANDIALAAGTTIVIQQNVRYLVIIANAISVGDGVTITYDQIPVQSPPGVPGKPPQPSGRPVAPSGGSAGAPGYQGSDGSQPLQIATPPNAPEVEIWTLGLNQLPVVNLEGQPGYTGVRGGDGGDGGRGGDGSESYSSAIQCKWGPGPGGPGGKGGRGGTGGMGGNGGTGGRFSLYTQSTIIAALPPFLIDVAGGQHGEGGPPGNPGNGGSGGDRGAVHKFCANQNWSNRTGGPNGPAGDSGAAGPPGVPGTAAGPDAERFVAINENDFLNKLTDPAITEVNPATTTVGTAITLSGFRFTPTDIVQVSGVATPLTYFSDTLVQCVVPNVSGGLNHVQVFRGDGTGGSNLGTLFVQPTITSTVPPSPATRLKPGSQIVVHGTGLGPQTSVRINGTDIGVATAVDAQTITFVMKRPTSVPYDPAHAAGEPATLTVASGGPVLSSNALPIVVATYQITSMGDSIQNGEGLQDPQKYRTLVAAHVTAANQGMSVYMTDTSHCGADLGWNDTGSGPALPRDVPTSYPTVKQQAQMLAALPSAATVDLVMFTGGANDVGLKHVLDPNATHAAIDARVEQYCHAEMTSFLTWLAGAFPVAKILLCGVYPGFSPLSDPQYLPEAVACYFGAIDNDGEGLFPEALAAAHGIGPAGYVAITGNALYFATRANAAFAAAVHDANVSTGGTRIEFVDPQFKPENAALAPDPWVFGLHKALNVLQPADDPTTAQYRAGQCSVVYPHDGVRRTYCDLASTGHPNVTGAQKYAEAIIAHL